MEFWDGSAAYVRHITAGYMRIPVDRNIQNKLHCYNCQRFGHGKAHCRREQACAKCGQVGHDRNDCQQREHCINCNGSHTAASRTCPKWIIEKRVQQIRAEKNIPFKQARELAVAEQSSSGPTMATVASAPRATVRGPPARPAARTLDAKCQTEFTWPDSEKFPVRLTAAENSTQTTSRSSETPENAKTNHRHSQSGASTHSDERHSSKHSGGGSGRPRIQRPPAQTAGQADTSNRFAALQSTQMEGVEDTDTAVT